MLISSLRNFFEKHKKSFFYVILGITFFYLSTQYGFAEGEATQKDEVSMLIDVLNGFLQLVAALL